MCGGGGGYIQILIFDFFFNVLFLKVTATDVYLGQYMKLINTFGVSPSQKYSLWPSIRTTSPG